MPDFRIRSAKLTDISVLHKMIRELAHFLSSEHLFLAAPDDLRKHLFENPAAKCLIAELTESNSPVGYCIYYTTFSTFRGKLGMHLEDIYVRDGFREKKIGRALIHALCRIAKSEGYCRIQWEAPVDNERARRFYDSLDVPVISGWLTYRLTNALEDTSASQGQYIFEEGPGQS